MKPEVAINRSFVPSFKIKNPMDRAVERGRGGNFYLWPRPKKGPKSEIYLFWVIFQNFTGAPDEIHHSLYGPADGSLNWVRLV
jgi:hypothetical protein